MDKGANGGTEFIRADLADARAAAGWQAGIDALLDRVGDLPISEIAADEVIYAAKQLTPPTDPAALDRLIAERVREALEAEREACRQIVQSVINDPRTKFWGDLAEARERIALRGSKEGRDG